MEQVFVNGVGIYPFASVDELLGYALEKKRILVAVNAEKIINATPQTRSIVNNNIGYCDGVGAVMAMRQKGFKSAVKIPGCELWLEIISRRWKEASFYFVGSKQEIIEATIAGLRRDFDGMRIAGYRNGYINSDSDKAVLIEDIERTKPDFVFVAMGSPKQEMLMEEMMQHHEAVYQGLGGSFDVYTGNVERAPKWWCEHGLEWAYRLIKQPARIKRQLPLLGFYLKLKAGKL